MFSFHLKAAPIIEGQSLKAIDERVASHAKVARIKPTEEFSLFYQGTEYICSGLSIVKSALCAKIKSIRTYTRGDLSLIVAIAAIPKPKLEEAVFILSQLGVDAILVVQMRRSTAKIKDAFALRQRLVGISISSCEISGNPFPPSILTALKVSQVARFADELAPMPSHRLLFYEEEAQTALGLSRLITAPYDEGKVFAVIGPEGGIEPYEAELLKKAGFQTVSLGTRILESRAASYLAASALALWMRKLGNIVSEQI